MKLRSQIVILCGIGALLMSFDLKASKAGNEIFYVKEHLTAHLAEANLKEVLSSVAKEAKVAFSLNEAIGAKKVSVRFDKLPLEEGIKRIIRPFNYSMIFGSLGRLEKVIIFERGSNTTSKAVFVADFSELPKAIYQEDYDPSIGPPGSDPDSDEGLPSIGPDEGLPSIGPPGSDPESEKPQMEEGIEEDQHPSLPEDSDMEEEAAPHPAGDAAASQDVRDPTPSAEGPAESP